MQQAYCTYNLTKATNSTLPTQDCHILPLKLRPARYARIKRCRLLKLAKRGICLLLLTTFHADAQTIDIACIAYNIENLFNPLVTINNPDTTFTPLGENHWTYKRLHAKVNMIARAIIATAGWHDLGIIGLSEVEDGFVLQTLLRNTPLASQPLAFIHRDSPDPRGIDVAIIYNYQLLTLIETKWTPLPIPSPGHRSSREILLASFCLPSQDTLHVIQCHWPSKFSGTLATQPLRQVACNTLNQIIDSLQQASCNPYIIAMGDFNSTSNDTLLASFSQQWNKHAILDNRLLCLSGLNDGLPTSMASHKFQGVWESIDHIFISTSLTKPHGLHMLWKDPPAKVPDFLLEHDNAYGGKRPCRTYLGPQYHGGISDHLPICIILRCPTKRKNPPI